MNHSRSSFTQVSASDEIPSFNSVTDHYQTILGAPRRSADLQAMPAPVRWFGYFFYSLLAVCSLLFVVGVIATTFF